MGGHDTGHPRIPLATVALVAAAALGYEVLLIRLLAIVQWQHFAHFVISLALLGIGASGTCLTLWRDALLERTQTLFLAGIALYALALPGAFALAQRIDLRVEAVLWEPAIFLRLAAVYLVLAIPFFLAGGLIGLALTRFAAAASRVYAADLLGSGLGSLAVVGLLFAVPAEAVLQALAALATLALAAAWLELGRRPRGVAPLLIASCAWPLLLPPAWIEPAMNQFKPLSQALAARGAQVIAQRTSPRGRIDVLESPERPLRHAPGLSLATTAPLPEQLGLFTDGAGLSTVQRVRDSAASELAYLADLTSALPYALADPVRVLVLEAGGGAPVWQALLHDAPAVEATIADRNVLELVRDEYAAFAGRLYSDARVNLHRSEPRGFVAGTQDRYALIALDLVQSAGAAPSGLAGARQTPLLTVDALAAYLGRLTDGGLLGITLELSVPPRQSLKLVATAAAALQRIGAAEPARHVAMIRDWQTATLLVKQSPLTGAELGALREFCRLRSFDTVYYPGMQAAQANRYNVLDRPWFAIGARALLEGDAAAFMRDYKFDITPPTDVRPYFADFFRWSALPEIVAARGRGGAALFEAGYPMVIAALLQALLLGVVLIVVPLGVLRGARLTGRVAGYFTALGLAFLMIEIAFLNVLTLLLNDEVLAAALTLGGFLVFAGLGAAFSSRVHRTTQPVRLAIVAIVLLGLGMVAALGPLLRLGLAAPPGLRLAAALALLIPMAFAMGWPFPLGLAATARQDPRLVPWAWCINGCASVVSPLLAAVLAIDLGLAWLLGSALALYAAAALMLPGGGKG